jgi:hypothetical protein
MVNKRPQARSLAGVAGLTASGIVTALIWGIVGSSVACAEDWEIRLSRDAVPPTTSLERIALRPNVQQSIYLFVANNTNNAEEVVVRLLKLTVDGKPPQPLGEKPLLAPGKNTVPVSFAKPPEEGKPPAGQPAAAAPQPPPMIPLEGPPFKLLIQVLKKDQAMELAKLEVPVSIQAPQEYVGIGEISYQIGKSSEENTFVVELRAKNEFSGPPCSVELELLPEQIPGLSLAKRDGNYKQSLRKGGQAVQLVAKNLKFKNAQAPESGLVSITVDGYPRAFVFATDFSRPGTKVTPEQERTRKPTVRVLDDRKATPPVDKVTLHLEVDSAPSRDVRLEVGADRDKDNQFDQSKEEIKVLRGDRSQRVAVSTADPSGALLFKSEVQDWQVELDTAGVFGVLPLRMRMYQVGKDEAGKEKIQWVDMIDRTGKDVEGREGIRGMLIFDDSPPENVRFAAAKDFPRQLERGAPLPVKATGADPESEISQVVFFVGKPVADKEGKKGPPPNVEVTEGRPLPGSEPGWWVAQLPIPSDKKGIVDVTTQFVNRAGQSTFETIKIELVEPGVGTTGAAAAKKYKIEGKVAEGEVLQPGLEVMLRDDKGAVKATTKTGKEGKLRGAFTFENVPPGVYTVAASKVASKTKGEAPVTVDAKDVKDVEIQLLR